MAVVCPALIVISRSLMTGELLVVTERNLIESYSMAYIYFFIFLESLVQMLLHIVFAFPLL